VLNEDISDENFILEESISSLDMIVAATKVQELNVVTALYLKSIGVYRAAAMVQVDGYAKIARSLGVDVVVPIKQVVIDSILSHLMGDKIKKMRRIGDGNAGIMELEISLSSSLCNKSIVMFHIAAGALVLLASRGKKSFIPRGDYVFEANDHIIIIYKKGSENEIEKIFK
jgi:trk system potassium uptake protein TrkA